MQSNLRAIIKKHTTHTKGKRVVLKGHFDISTQELCDAVAEATKRQTRKRQKQRARLLRTGLGVKGILMNAKMNLSEIRDCIIVDIE